MEKVLNSDDRLALEPPSIPGPITGSARLLKIRYRECSGFMSPGSSNRSQHGYKCVNLPGLRISNPEIANHQQLLSEDAAQFLTILLGEERFDDWSVLMMI